MQFLGPFPLSVCVMFAKHLYLFFAALLGIADLQANPYKWPKLVFKVVIFCLFSIIYSECLSCKSIVSDVKVFEKFLKNLKIKKKRFISSRFHHFQSFQFKMRFNFDL